MKFSNITAGAALLALINTPIITMAGASFDTAKKEATAEINKAKSAGHEWRDSRKILGKAEAAEKAGDHDKAIKLANKAKKQGIDAVAQAKSQAKAGPY